MNVASRCLVGLAFLGVPQTAIAHPVFGGTGGFSGGLLHPLFVPAHVLAIVGAGLLLSQEAQRGSRGTQLAGLTAFAAGLAAGLVAIANAYVPTLSGETLLALAAIAGMLVAISRPFLRFTPILLVALTGYVVALDSPPDVISMQEAIFIQLGTFCGATVFFFVLTEAASRLKANWQRIGARILGSWIAASAILVLALRLVR